MKTPGPDSKALSEAINSLMDGMGRGGLTYISDRLGMTPSAMRKRLSSKPFDEPTMRAVILIAGSKAEDFTEFPLESETVSGGYLIQVRNVNGESIPTWRVNEAS